jgi:uncharacterized protein
MFLQAQSARSVQRIKRGNTKTRQHKNTATQISRTPCMSIFRNDDDQDVTPDDPGRRDWLSVACIACLAIGGMFSSDHAHAMRLDEDANLFNPCKSPLPEKLARHELVQRAWEGINPALYWDSHVHLLGVGDGNTGCWINPRMRSLLSPKLYLQKKFFLNAACVGKESEKAKTVDADYVTRLKQLVDEMPQGAKLMLFAFDRTHPVGEGFDLQKTAFYVPNSYAANIAKQFPDRFAFVASVHPYRQSGEKMEATIAQVVADGAVAIKWLPAAMGIDPASPKCDAMYAACKKYNLPIITHAGEEKAVEGAHQQHFGNPLRLRRPLDQGVKIVVAHCASMGTDIDLDQGHQGKGGSGKRVPSFQLFERLMAEKRYEANLFADISAIPQANRAAALADIVVRDDWTHRLVHGSDYPLPGVMPLFSVDGLVERGWLPKNEATVIKSIREYNPLLFDFVLKRSLRINGKSLHPKIFESARLFSRKA